MTPVDQEFIADPSIGQWGDCKRAVMASLLDLPLSQVPNFLAEAGGDALKYWQLVQRFLGQHGCVLVEYNGDIGGYPDFYGSPDIYHEISGPSPRGNGMLHVVVGCNGKVVHDPHPSKAGLAGNPDHWKHSVLVRLNGGK